MYAIQIFHNFTIQLLSNSLNVPWQRLNNKIKNIHERALRIVYQDKKSSLKTLVKRDKSTSIHMKNLQYLATKLFKVKNYLSPEIMKETLLFKKMKLTI